MSDLIFVGRGGLKLRHALDTFAVDPRDFVCVDLGCSTGGFTDCLLQAGAAKVFAVDTAYGQLAWKLRKDPRVVVCERSNGLHLAPKEPVDLTVADMGWTPQRLLIPAAVKWLKPGGAIISLIKPHYELKEAGRAELPRGGVLDPADAEKITNDIVAKLPQWGVVVKGLTRSPLLGGEHKGKGTGNAEWLVWAQAN
ncbi:MAG: TlyA family RNA methyltransferase [Phycisphaerales bacterium]